MVIINRTPDFQGPTFEPDRAVDAAIAAAGDGTDVVDAGGVRRRPARFSTQIASTNLCLTISPLLEAGDAHRIVVGSPEKVRHMTLHVLVSDGAFLLRYLRASRGNHADLR